MIVQREGRWHGELLNFEHQLEGGVDAAVVMILSNLERIEHQLLILLFVDVRNHFVNERTAEREK